MTTDIVDKPAKPVADRIGWPRGYAIILRQPDPTFAKQATKARAELGKVNGKRATFAPIPATPAGRFGPGSRRTVDQARADWAKLADSELSETNHRRPILPGYGAELTDGNMAVGLAGPTTDKAPLFSTWTPIGTLELEAWTAYAPIRQIVKDGRSGAVAWTWADSRLTWYGEDGYSEVIGRNWIPFDYTGDPITVTLNNSYLWPARGVVWTIGIARQAANSLPAIILTAGDLLVVVMGMKDK